MSDTQQETSERVSARVIKVNKAPRNDKINEMIEPSQSQHEVWENLRQVVVGTGALEPPYPKDMLARIAERSPALQESLRVYQLVIEGYGNTFESVLLADEDQAFDQVKMSMWMDRIDEDTQMLSVEPSDDEVNEQLTKIKLKIRFQKMAAERFFKNAGREDGKPISFVKLRQLLRQDKEIMGESYLEVLRDNGGNIRRLAYLPSISMFKFALDGIDIPVEVPERVDPFTLDTYEEQRCFRKYVQVDPFSQELVFFKEFGDPRTLSSKTGNYYESDDELLKEEPDSGAKPANEVICDKIKSPLTPYGVPRWIANSPAIGGSRRAEEINFDYLDNKGIPDFIFMVAGGQLGSQADTRIAEFLRNIRKGSEFHSVLVLEAAPFDDPLAGQTPHRVNLDVKALSDHLPKDALFLKYLEFNDTRIGASFNVPPILRGRVEEYTRATAREALVFFESMVAEPERNDFDEDLNTHLLPQLGLTLVLFRSLGPDTSDPLTVARVIDTLLRHGSLVPQDGRQEAEKLLGRELPNIKEDWVKKPLKLTISEVMAGRTATSSNAEKDEESTLFTTTVYNELVTDGDNEQWGDLKDR